jgi:integrase
MPRKRNEGTRAPNGSASFYQDANGRWHGRVTMGVRDDGKPDRRHVRGKTETDVVRKVRALEKARDEGNTPRIGRVWTVEKWLTHWLDNIAAPFVRESTRAGYSVAVRVHLAPGVGAHRLDRLQPEHLERLYARMLSNGSAPGTVHQAHRTIRTALNEAVRRGYLARNPATLAKAPQPDSPEVVPYSLEEVRRILIAAQSRRNSARWAVALALGLRQGEALGLQWPDVNLAAGTLAVRRGRQRPGYTHGCGGSCGRAAGYCPERRPVRPDTASTKSRNGRRVIGLPLELVSLLREHREEQDRERDAAAQLWHDGAWVFASPTGQPLNPSTDYHEWKRLLRSAGVRDGRLHDARHTAATVLLILGVPERVVLGLMGWSHGALAGRYQHLTDAIRQDVAQRIDGLIWAAEDLPDDRDDGPAGVRVPA